LLDVSSSLKFDRIYVGAGAYRDARRLFKLLKSDGIIVGPFQEEDGENQTLIKARRFSASQFAVCNKQAVTFAWLRKPTDAEELNGTLTLRGPQFGASTPSVFPWRFKRTILLMYWMVNYVTGSVPGTLPWDFWVEQILPWLPFDSFDVDDAKNSHSRCAACGGHATKTCAYCKSVRYCSRDCQQADWVSHKKLCQRPRKVSG